MLLNVIVWSKINLDSCWFIISFEVFCSRAKYGKQYSNSTDTFDTLVLNNLLLQNQNHIYLIAHRYVFSAVNESAMIPPLNFCFSVA